MKYYVSVTGLQLKSILYYPRFIIHAVPSSIQAEKAEGNVIAKTMARNGIQHTLTVWENRQAMLKYMRAGAHLQAMKITNQVSAPEGTKVYGYESDTIPTWDEALELWDLHGTRHGKPVPSTKGKGSATSTGLIKNVMLVAVLAVAGLAVASARLVV